MKYKVGDKVRVRKDLEIDKDYDGLSFDEDMAYFKGKIVTIKAKNTFCDHYRIEEDKTGWFWTDEMLEDIKENEKMSKLEDLEIKYKELGEEIEKLKKEKEENKVWKPLAEEDYWYIDEYGDVDISFNYDEGSYDRLKYTLGNCFKSQEEAEKVAEKIKIYTELKRYALEHNEEIDDGFPRYYIYFDMEYESFGIDCWRSFKEIGQIYFSSRAIAEQAIEEIGEEKLKKLFEEEE